MPYTVIIEPNLKEEGVTLGMLAEALLRLVKLGPTTIKVDAAGIGQPILADLQSRYGLPAVALEKRERPSLAEVQYATSAKLELEAKREECEKWRREAVTLSEHLKDLRTLIGRLE